MTTQNLKQQPNSGSNSSIIELPSLMHPDAWDDPIFFDDIETPNISGNILPGIFGEFAAGLAQAMETPEALSVMAILGVISTIVAKRFKVSPKEGWHEPLNIYTLIALPPANHKSIILRHCTAPLIKWEREQVHLHAAEIKRRYSERKTQEKIIEALRCKAGKLDDVLEQQSLMQDIAQKETELSEIPVLPQLFVNDVTPESLLTLMHEQDGRLAIFSDEGGVLETLSGLYSNGVANIDILLKGIDGGEIRVRRKDKNILLNPYLTVVLAVQPSIIQQLADKKAFLGNGTLERFLYAIPKSNLGYRTHNKPPLSKDIEEAYHNKIQALLNKFVGQNNPLLLHPKQQLQMTQVLTLSPEAYDLWHGFQADTESDLRPDGRLASCLGWGGKLCGYMLRLAGLLHIAKLDVEAEVNLTIDYDSMTKAFMLAALLTEHAIAAFGLMGLDQPTADAKLIWQWLKSRQQQSFTQSELLLALRNRRIGKSERLSKALRLLKERNLISGPIKLPTRKPTTIYYVSPVALESKSEKS